jgi:hypothetical protein
MNLGCLFGPAEEELRARVEALMAQLANNESEKERLNSENRELTTRLAEEEQATNRSVRGQGLCVFSHRTKRGIRIFSFSKRRRGYVSPPTEQKMGNCVFSCFKNEVAKETYYSTGRWTVG